MEVVVGVLVLIAVLLGILFGVIFWQVRRVQARRLAELSQRYPKAKEVLPNVNFFGRKSEGVGQMRGNGTMLITDDELVFELWIPRKLIVIPLENITSIATPKSFLGKSYFKPLLQLDFTDETGRDDSAAWFVPDLEATIMMVRRH